MPWPRIIHAAAFAERLRQLAAQLRVADEQVVVGAHLADLEDRHAGIEEGRHVVDRLHLRLRHAERDHRVRVAMDDRHHVGALAVDLAVQETLEVGAPFVADRLAVGSVLHDVAHLHQLGRHGARHVVAVGMLVAAHAHVAVAVEHALHREDAIGGDEVHQQVGIGGRCLAGRHGDSRRHYRVKA
jgi:hypothetical protein